MQADYVSYSVMREHAAAPAAVDWSSSLDLVRFWQSCLNSFKPFRPYASCSLFFDFDGFQPLCAKHHLLRSGHLAAKPGTGLVVAGPYLESHPRHRIYTYSQIVHEDPTATLRRLEQEPEPDWDEFVQMAFWHEGKVEAVLNIAWSREYGGLSQDDLDVFEQLYPLIDAGLHTLQDLEVERLRSSAMERSIKTGAAALLLLAQDGSLLYCSPEAHRHCLNWNRGLLPGMPMRLHLPDGLPLLLEEALQSVAGPPRYGQEGTLVRIAHPLIPRLALQVDVDWHAHGIRRRPCYAVSFVGGDGHPALPAPAPGAEGTGLLQRLTPRERVVALLVAEGLGNDEIASRLNRSRRTVESQLVSIFRKLEVRTRLQLLRVLH